MENVVANLTASVRRETLHGREYLVGSLSLIIPGVLNGSQGSLYYPLDEIARTATHWNGMPIVVYHPTVDGQGVSARHPEVFNNSGIGTVYHAKANGKLTAEGWFDVESVKRVDDRILAALEAGKLIELSTGLFTDNEIAPSGASYDGKAYTHIARNYRPDHVAILPDEVGACSISDGCGVLINGDKNKLGELLGVAPNQEKSKSTIPDLKGEHVMDSVDRENKISRLIADSDCWGEPEREVLNSLADDKLELLVTNMRNLPITPPITEFEDVQGNKHVLNTETGKWTSEFKKQDPPPDPKEKKPQTDEEWMETAPPGIQSAVRNAMDIEAREKEQLIGKLIANLDEAAGKQVREALEDQSLSYLRAFSVLAPKPKTAQPSYLGAAGATQNIKTTEDSFASFGLPHEYIEEASAASS